MATKIENLATTLELIRANSQAAEREAKNWQDFVLRMTSRYPEIQIIDSQEEFSAWAGSHPELNIDPSLFKGKEIIEAYFYLREQKEVQNAPKAPMEINPQLNALGMMGLPALAIIFRDAPKILEADKDYQKIIASKKTEWQEKNPGKNLLESEEGLNYLYGDPNDPDKKTMDDEAEEKFRELAKTNNILAKRLEKYDLEKQKIYKNPNNDSSLMHFSAKINEEAQARISLFKKNKKNVTDEELKITILKIEEKNYLIFAKKSEAKANAYALFDERLKKALQKIPKKEIAKEKEEEEEKKEKKEDQISPGQVRRLAEELQKEQKAAEISNIRKPIPGQRPPVSQSPMTRPTAPGFTQRPSIPKINLGGLGREAGQGLGRAGGLLGRGGGLAARGGTMAIGALAGLGWPVIVGIAAVLLITIIILIIVGGMGGGIGGGLPGSGIGGDITGCTFYRGGDKEPGLQFGNPQMAETISDISTKVGVPTVIIAGIMRVESSDAVRSTDQTYLTNDYEAKFSTDKETGLPVAYGVMQFKPSTFLDYYNVNSADLRTIFAKTDIKITIDPQNNMAPSNFLRIYSIKDSITAAAFKVKNDKYTINKDGPYDETTVKKIAERYYGVKDDGTTNYQGADGSTQNYGNDLWKSFQNCQPSTPSGPGGGSGEGGAPTQCSGTPISLSAEKILLPLPSEKAACTKTETKTCGRPGTCVVPAKIVLHTTGGSANAMGTYNYFASGSDNRGVGSHFIIGKEGQTLQLVESLTDRIEVAYAVAGYIDHISIEIVHTGVYNSKNDLPPAQYQAVLSLVRELMSRYNIPVGNISYEWSANGGRSDQKTSEATPGIYGHYQLNPLTRKDPGQGLVRDLRNDLK